MVQQVKERKTFRKHASQKLEEARFNLNLLKEENQKVFRSEPNAFKNYLNAFLHAAYTVDCALQRHAEKNGIRKWRETLLSSDEAKFLDSMLRRRGAEVHDLGAAILTKEKPIPAESVPGVQVMGPPTMFLGEAHLRRTRELGLPQWTQAWVNKPEYYFKTKHGPLEVIQTCHRYIALLEHLVRDFPWGSENSNDL